MDKVCPLCNALQKVSHPCPNCGIAMVDEGPMENFFGPYSPYEDKDLLELNNGLIVEGPDPCIHLLSCSKCAIKERIIVEKISI